MPYSDYQVQPGERQLMMAKAFPYKALDTIALDRVTRCLYRNGGTQSRVAQSIIYRQNCH